MYMFLGTVYVQYFIFEYNSDVAFKIKWQVWSHLVFGFFNYYVHTSKN